KAGRQLIGQTANILLFLGPRLGLAPRDAAGKLWVHQLQLTIADFVGEIHDTHHPLGPTLYYEDQKPEAKRRTKEFLAQRMPKYLDYFERVIERNRKRGPWMAGNAITYVDLSMAQVIAGLGYAFPNAARKALAERPRLAKLRDAVFARPRIRRYVESPRRIAFNNDDVFRRYPELGS
ncbi:MAG TPA: glutathione S-transferase C-terminal domain-containing protein, partial [Usitatibacter sp.]|nr:glutathione S-transferase C-terminal domain-containing protein [Usitatibacter sp.]